MAIRPSDVDDFLLLTIDNYDLGRWEDLTTDQPNYASARLFKEKGVTVTGGARLKWPLETGTVDTARNAGLYDHDQTAVGDIASMAEIPWAMQTVNWSYDIDEEGFQDDDLTIVDMLKMRAHGAQTRLVELNERNLWNAPSSTTDNRPHGIPYWIVKDATTVVEGDFTASLPSGHTTIAAIDPAQVTGWRNWAFGYTSATVDDLVRKVKRAMRHTDFETPVPHPQLAFSGAADQEIFTTEDILAALEVECENRNENHGNDLARFVNDVVIKGVPVRLSWFLEATDSTDPVYGIDWRFLRPFIKRGADKRKTIKPSPTQRNVRTVHYDTWMNYRCLSRRRQWCGSKS